MLWGIYLLNVCCVACITLGNVIVRNVIILGGIIVCGERELPYLLNLKTNIGAFSDYL